jgi:peroxidase
MNLFTTVLAIAAGASIFTTANGSEPANRVLHRLKKASPYAIKMSEPSRRFLREAERQQTLMFGANALARLFSAEDIDLINNELEQLLKNWTICRISSSATLAQGKRVHNNGANVCSRRLNCNHHQRYRTIDGTCNNPQEPTWGSVDIALLRLADPVYNDGFNSLRSRGKDGNLLPGPRSVSITVTPATERRPARRVSWMVFRLGQFLDHDISFTPEDEASDEEESNPCERTSHTAPIPIPANDPFYDPKARLCLPFTRSLPQMEPNSHKKGPKVVRQQINDITAFIDASNVYGSTKEIADKVREPGSAFLRTTLNNNEVLLPLRQGNETGCVTPQTVCFRAGDSRVNENLGLASMHTMWVVRHNQIAGQLQQQSPWWSNEKVFQETRKIIGAMHQHITYNEFLPVVLGRRGIRQHNLRLHDRLTQTYNSSCNPGASNEFATAAFRFGHTLVSSQLLAAVCGARTPIDLVDTFDNPSVLTNPGFVGGILKGDTERRTEQFDRFIVSALRNELFQTNATMRNGLDLIALNIQRGRDHGLPGYTKYLKICGRKEPTSWRQLGRFVTRGALRRLRRVYRSVQDIDLFVGMVSEPRVRGGLIGNTGACILAEQFRRLRCGDRFWYKNKHANGFTAKQFEEIKKTTLAGTICAAMIVGKIREDAFDVRSRRIPCYELPQLDLSAWRYV